MAKKVFERSVVVCLTVGTGLLGAVIALFVATKRISPLPFFVLIGIAWFFVLLAWFIHDVDI